MTHVQRCQTVFVVVARQLLLLLLLQQLCLFSFLFLVNEDNNCCGAELLLLPLLQHGWQPAAIWFLRPPGLIMQLQSEFCKITKKKHIFTDSKMLGSLRRASILHINKAETDESREWEGV